jgi:hypothetical protein
MGVVELDTANWPVHALDPSYPWPQGIEPAVSSGKTRRR